MIFTIAIRREWQIVGVIASLAFANVFCALFLPTRGRWRWPPSWQQEWQGEWWLHDGHDQQRQQQQKRDPVSAPTTPRRKRDLVGGEEKEPRQQKTTATKTTTETTSQTTSSVIPPSLRYRPDLDLSGFFNNRTRDDDNSNFLGFGGCLVIMDDNFLLVEWLAYHWLTLPLKHLTVLVDSKSRTSPFEIFERWNRDGKIRIEVVDWERTDAAYDRANLVDGNRDTPTIQWQLDTYPDNPDAALFMARHIKFQEDCLRSYKRRNWPGEVAIIDTDEFVVAKAPPLWSSVGKSNANKGEKKLETVAERLSKQYKSQSDLPDWICMRRKQICAGDAYRGGGGDADDARAFALVQEQLGVSHQEQLAKQFATYRWNSGYLLNRRKFKSFINVGRMNSEYFERLDVFSGRGDMHNILPDKNCTKVANYRIYHSDKTEEQETFRRDPRGPYNNRTGTANTASKVRFSNDTASICEKEPNLHSLVRPWLPSFIKKVGNVDEVKMLLAKAGETHSWPPYPTTTIKL